MTLSLHLHLSSADWSSDRTSVVSFQYSSEEEDERTARRQAWRSPRRSRTSSLTTSPTLKSRPLPSPTFSNSNIFPQIVPEETLLPANEEDAEEYLTVYHRRAKSAPLLPPLSATTRPFRTPRPKTALPPHRRRPSKYILADRKEQVKGWRELLVACTPARLEWILKTVIVIGVSAAMMGMVWGSYILSVLEDVKKSIKSLGRTWAVLWTQEDAETSEPREKTEEAKRPALFVLVPTLVFVLFYGVGRFFVEAYSKRKQANRR